VSSVSGDFSVGVEGLLIRGGELAQPVHEITIASTLQRMLLSMVAIGADVEWLPGVAAAQTIAIDGMSLSGSGWAPLTEAQLAAAGAPDFAGCLSEVPAFSLAPPLPSVAAFVFAGSELAPDEADEDSESDEVFSEAVDPAFAFFESRLSVL
jgi:hypothetical protein